MAAARLLTGTQHGEGSHGRRVQGRRQLCERRPAAAPAPQRRGRRRPPKPTKEKGRPKLAKREKPKFNPKGGRKACLAKADAAIPESKAAPPIPPKKPQLTVRVVGPDMRPSSGGSYDSRPGSSDSLRPLICRYL